jgi:hypothetical protein
MHVLALEQAAPQVLVFGSHAVSDGQSAGPWQPQCPAMHNDPAGLSAQ